MDTLINVGFLIVGLILGFLFGYTLERIKECRLRNKCADVLKNEIEVSCEDITEDFKLVENAKTVETPEGMLEEKIHIAAFLLSPSMYNIDAYESYLDKIFLFKSHTQKVIMNFYSVIKKIKRDLGSIQTIVKDIDVPDELVKDWFEKQYKLRETALEKAKLCLAELK